MKSAAHQYEDKLLEFAYGELPQHEAEAVDAHVRGCNRCSQALSEIRGVRAAMARLPMEPAPDAGLESLLAYAEQAAKRNAAEAKPAPSFFKRFMMPLASLAALITVGVVGFRASQEFDTTPAGAIADQKLAAMEEAKGKAEETLALKEADEQAAKAVAQTEKPPAQPTEVNLPPVAAAAPQAPAADPSPSYEMPANKAYPDPKKLEVAKNEFKKDAPSDRADDGLMAARGVKDSEKEGRVAADELDNVNAGGKLGTKGAYDKAGAGGGDTWSPPPSNSKRSKAVAPVGNAEVAQQDYRQSNYSDVGSRAAKLERQELAKTPPPPPPAPPSEARPSFGLGTSSPGSGAAQGSLGGASTRDTNTAGPLGISDVTTKPSPVAPPKTTAPKPEPKAENSYLAEKQREEKEKVAAAKDAQAKQSADEDRRALEQERPAPAPVVAAPTIPSAAPSSSYAPSKKKSGGYGIIPQTMGRESISGEGAMDEEAALQKSDSVGLNNDAKFAENTRRKAVTESVERARVASSSGDRMQEIQLLQQALANGATGYEKAEALKRICDAYDALGEPETGDRYCSQLLREFPNTVAAKVVSERRNRVQRSAPAPKKPAAAERRFSDDASPAPKPAEAAPAQAY